MTRVVQHRRGTTSGLASILGAPGELFVDTSLVTVVVHDGLTTGGVTLATQQYAQNAAPTATSSVLGKVQPDNTSIVVNSGIISVSSVLGNTKILPRTSSQTGSAGGTFTINTDLYDTFLLTALGNSATFNAPAGSPVNGQRLIIRIKDNGTARVLTFTGSGTSAFRGIGITLPSTTVLGKVLYVGCIYNADDYYWDVIATAQQA
jgi:hypothetical protein